MSDIEPLFITQPYYAPSCRSGPHWLTTHPERLAAIVGRECDCPCHRVNYTAPWWSEVANHE